MSVTFFPSPIPEPAGWLLRCWGDDDTKVADRTVPTFDEVAPAVSAHSAVCADCSAYGGLLVTPVATWPEAQMSQSNAALLLRTLGLVTAAPAVVESHSLDASGALTWALTGTGPGDDAPLPMWTGEEDATGFLGRVLTALGLAPDDAGIPATSTTRVLPSGGETFLVDCGRRPGYLQEKLALLREVADYAITNDLRVAWS